MKYALNFLLLFVFCFILASCGGGDDAVTPDTGGTTPVDTGGTPGTGTGTGTDTTTTPPPTDPNPKDGAISPIPETFTQKIVIEEATGTWCGWCVMGAGMMEKYTTKYPDRVFGVAVHGGSPTEPMLNKAMLDNLARVYDLSGFPSGLVNRSPSSSSRDLFMHPLEWAETIDKQLEKTSTTVGIALESNINETDALATVQVHVGFGKNVSKDTKYRILIYLVEDGIVSPQQNYLSGDLEYKGTEFNNFFEAPAVIQDFVHNHVAKRAFTSLDGELIEAANVGDIKKFKKTFQLNLTRNDNLAKLSVVAVLIKDASRPVVLNAQKVKLGETKDWD